jgi:cell division protein FtsZ
VERAFAHGTTVMSSALRALCHLITRPGYINLDIADLREMVRHSGGSCALGYARASGEGRVAAVLHDLLEGTLLQEGERVREAGALLVGIVGGPDLAVHEVGNIMQAINGVTTESCNVTMGTTINEDQSDVIEVLALVSEIWTGEPSPAQGQAEGNQRRRRKGAVGGKARHTQALLGLQMAGRGRFKNVEATVVDGEDLDIPTFTRRGISLDA